MGVLKATRWMCTNLFFDSLRAPLSPKYLRMFRHLLFSQSGWSRSKVTCVGVLSTGHAERTFNYYYLLLLSDRHYYSSTPTRTGCGELLSFFLVLSKYNYVIRCTRWFIPLLILPLPSSPPYFLILFLISMIIHARPWYVPHHHRPRLI